LDLAASVVVKAVRDWKTYGQATDCAIGTPAYVWVIHEAGFSSPRAELIAFFCSEWCRSILSNFAVDYDAMMEELQKKWGFPDE
jgi:hypothetical protein